jgi:hypothetical protein
VTNRSHKDLDGVETGGRRVVDGWSPPSPARREPMHRVGERKKLCDTPWS